ncbi:MAG: alpha-2-macroglobulin family protein [Bacteroidota bacterium]
MSKQSFFLLLVGALFLCTAIQCKTQKPTVKSPVMETNNKEPYVAEWKIIDSLEQKGLPKSALEKVEQLYDRAEREDQPAQMVKCLLYRSKYQASLEEDGLVKVLNSLQTQMEQADSPIKAILQSVTAEIYSRYLDQNYWRLSNRTETTDFKAEDIGTWTPGQFMEACQKLYWASLEEEQLKQIAATDFDAITFGDHLTASMRPTLYDFLGHRAIDYFMNERSYLPDPAYKFYINQPTALSAASEFIKLSFDTEDTLSAKYNTLLLLQEMTAFHLADSDPSALIDVDLKRLKFVYDNGVFTNKNTLYQKALEALHKKYDDHPSAAEITAQLAQLYLTKMDNAANQPQNPDRENSYKIAYELCQQAIDKFPESLGANRCQQLQNQILQKQLDLTAELVNSPNKPFRALVRYRNISKVYLRAVSLNDEQFEKLNALDYNSRRDFIRQLPALKNWSVDLPASEDYLPHSVEIKVDALPVGRYLLLSSDNEEFNYQGGALANLTTYISNIAYLHRRGESGSVEFALTNRQTGEPLEGVKATFFIQQYDQNTRTSSWKNIGSKTSDVNGFLSSQSIQGRSFCIRFDYQGDFIYLDNRMSNYSNNNRRRINQLTHFFTDRALYRPGQTVYFKALLLEKDLEQMPRILPDTEVEITFLDANWQEVGKLKKRSNEYGTVSGSFTAPSSGLLGRMVLRSSVGGSRSSFRVEEYKRPKFEVVFDKVGEASRLGETVSMKGHAKAFAGNNIDGAKVNYRVVREARFPYLPWYYRRWGFPQGQSNSMEIVNGTSTTDDNGRFEVSFEAAADPSIPADQKPEFTFIVYADVTDITGETHSGNGSMKVGYVALDIDIPLATQINRDSLKLLTLKARNLNGEPEKAAGSIRIEKLKDPERIFRKRQWAVPDQHVMSQEAFYAAFPNDPFEDEDQPANFAIDRQMMEQDFNTANQSDLAIQAATWPAGHYKLTLDTKDKYGTAVALVKYFLLYDLEDAKVAGKESDFYVQEARKYEPDQTAVFAIGSAKPIKVLYELEHQEKIIRREWLAVDGQRKISLPIEEKHRGNLHYSLSFILHNRVYIHKSTIYVPWSNKELTIEYETFRDKLLPGQDEEWRLKISGPKKEQIAAEMVATLYDASLDQLAGTKNWDVNLFPSSYAQLNVRANNFGTQQSTLYADNWQLYTPHKTKQYRRLNWFGFDSYAYAAGRQPRFQMDAMSNVRMEVRGSAPMEEEMDMSVEDGMEKSAVPSISSTPPPPPPPPPVIEEVPEGEQAVKVRTNLNETVFFYPDLRTDAQGNIIVRFKMNEALTRWKFMAFAHTKDLKSGQSVNEVVTQKELMVVPNPPRFFRERDEIEFTAKVSNLTAEELSGTAKLELFDAISMQPVDQLLGNEAANLTFTAKAGQSARLAWKLKIPVGKVLAITHRVTAKADKHSDGEESSLPVLTNRMLVTETMPLPVRGGQQKIFQFTRMQEAAASTTLQHHRLTLEYTSNPAWYAVQSLPYLMEYPHACTEQIFNRYYANSLATSVANAHPKIKRVFDQWKNTEAMESNLSKNEELKSALQAETPWVLQAQNEAQQKQNIGLLFDLNRMSREQEQAVAQLAERQLSSGGFSWFPGGQPNWYITQYLVEGMGHLEQLGVKSIRQEERASNMLRRAIVFIDERMARHYKELEARIQRTKGDLTKDHLDYLAIHYLYTRSFFKDIPQSADAKTAHAYYLGQAEKFWLGKGMYLEGMLALALQRYERRQITGEMIASFRERALQSEELGMYWKYDVGYHWYKLPIETHALMIEVFDEVANDPKAVDDLKVWLLKVKQTTHWKTTKATAAAVYALLRRGDNWLLEDQPVEIRLGKQPEKYSAKIKQAQRGAEAGTGYFKTAWQGSEIGSDMQQLVVNNPNKVVAWGALYWQYFEELDKITSFEETPLKMKKQLFKEIPSDRGPVMEVVPEGGTLKVGDKLKVRIELRVDRPMEYVHMKDMRASGLEPINVLSQYKWQGGLGYYESPGDVSTNFFFSYLPKGTYVFEYPLRVIHNGNFSNGMSSIQSMYAPEFTSHSEGIRIEVTD